jgi:hypothetical protein
LLIALLNGACKSFFHIAPTLSISPKYAATEVAIFNAPNITAGVISFELIAKVISCLGDASH